MNNKIILNPQKGLQQLTICMCLFFAAQLQANVTSADSTELSTKLSAKLANILVNPKNGAISIPQLGAEITLKSPSQYKFEEGLDQKNYSAGAEFWSKTHWGLSGKIEENGLNLSTISQTTESTRIDLNRKLLSSHSSNSYLAMGVGWQSVNVNNVIDTEGLSFSLLGKLALANNILLYGNGGLFQGLDENANKNQVTGYQIEAGLNYKVGSKFSFSAGLKVLDLEDQQFNRRSQTSSFLIGTSLLF